MKKCHFGISICYKWAW